ncbi:sister chromatid cohesion protein PDS5 homolog E-like [Gastrolobium bilobum]|uniref:sister chromatid cohesion protein PDS5 homolog E-like n=1 Tax=Gastrolobium bilobum TaxID=150636 RepID=UPI002AB092EC|nr:sister chromatid cohesion protein PDS5 homolog E-like [Gastrolobium bilobum]
MKALISDELLRHTDEDVKILVTSCITEITRITAPDAPYDDEHMKEIFKLIVAAFEKLSLASGRSYEKALTILENVSKTRLCLVMLDLECDDLVIEMFKHFLSIIRSNHPQNVAHSMESIMSLILNESEEISADLLRPLLCSVRKEFQTISPCSWTLGEKVINNCAVRLKPNLMKEMESSGRALNEYAQIVTSICQNDSETPQCDHSDGSEKAVVHLVENKLDVPKDANEQPCEETKRLESDIACVRDAQIMDDTKSNIRSARASAKDGEAIKQSGSKRKLHSDLTKNSKRSNAKTNSETGNLESVGEPKSETQLNTVPRKRGRKPNSLMNEEEGYDHSWILGGTKTGKSALSRKACDSNSAFSPSENPTSKKDKLQSKPKTVSEALISEPKNESIAKPAQYRKTRDMGSDFPHYKKPASLKDNVLSKPEDMSKGCEDSISKPRTDANADASPPFTNHNSPDGSYPKRGRPRKITSTGSQDIDPIPVSTLKEDHLNPLLEGLESPGVRLEKESEVRKDSEVKPQAPIRKITVKFDGKTAVAKMESKFSCEDEGKHKSAMNIDVENRDEGRSSAQKEVKKRRRLDATPNKGHKKSSDMKELISESASKTLSGVEETPRARLKRSRIAVSVEPSETSNHGNSLIGSRVKVWWPLDKMFYEGVIHSYDPVKGKHKILYADGDVEVLNLQKQRWELISVDDSPNEEEGLALQKLAEASDIAEKSKEKPKLELVKDANNNSRSSRGRGASASISRSESVKSAVKSVDTSSINRSDLADESMDDPPTTCNRQDSTGKPRTKRKKTGSDIKRNQPDT